MEGILIFFALLLSAFFSGSEMAFVTVNRLKAQVLSKQRGKLGAIVSDFLEHPTRFLTTTLVGNNVALVVYSTLMAIYLQEPIERFVTDTLGITQGTEILVLAIQTFVASLIVLIFGEIIPKTIFRDFAERAVFFLAIPLRITYYLLWPFIALAGAVSSLIVRLLGGEQETFNRFIRRDFEVIIRESRETGALELPEEESELLENIFELSSLRVKDVMIPRTEIVAVEIHTPIETVIHRIVESGHSRLPVYRDNIDNIVGIVYAHDLFKKPQSLKEIIRDVRFVPETKPAKDLLKEFLRTHTTIAIVIDEYGGTAGLVTIEDLLEELFGEIQDEFDVETPEIHQVDERTLIVSGRVELDTLEELFNIRLPRNDYETIAGFLIEHMGHIPAAGETFSFNGYHFTILRSHPNRIDQVKIETEEPIQKVSSP